MTIKRLSSLLMFFGIVLFSYAAANAQETTPAPPPTAKPQVVVTDPFEKPATPDQAAKPTSTTKTFGNYSVNVTETVTGKNLENGKFFTVTKWDGTRWVTKREWMPNRTAAPPPNQ